MRRTMTLIACALVAGACGGAATTTAEPATTAARAGEPIELCPGWVRHDAPGGTAFGMPGRGSREQQGNRISFVHAETDVYFQVDEQVFSGLDGGSDDAAIDGVLAGLGDPASARLDEGWSVVSQERADFQGRPAAERVLDIRGQIRRRELILRAGDTMVMLVTMVRHDRADSNAEPLRCFERSLRFAAPPSR